MAYLAPNSITGPARRKPDHRLGARGWRWVKSLAEAHVGASDAGTDEGGEGGRAGVANEGAEDEEMGTASVGEPASG